MFKLMVPKIIFRETSRKSKASGKYSIPERKPVGYSYSEMTICSIRLLSHLQRDTATHVYSR